MEGTQRPRPQSGNEHRPLIHAEEIEAAIRRVADQIAVSYPDGFQDVLAVIVLEGARRFGEALLAALPERPQIAYLNVKSYDGAASTGQVTMKGLESIPLHGRRVLLIDDIYDTGRTITVLLNAFKQNGAANIKTAVLLEKQRSHEASAPVDFVGLTVPDRFLVGFGLDHNGHFRDLDHIAVLTL